MVLLPANYRPDLSSQDQKKLTEYATVARYPGSGDISLAEVRRAVSTGRRVRKHIRGLLRKEVLQRSRP